MAWRRLLDRIFGNGSSHGDDAQDWPFDDPPNLAVITTRSVVRGGEWIASVSHDEDDGGWQFHDSHPGPLVESDAMIVGLGEMVRRDPSLRALADLPVGWHAWRTAPGRRWQRARRPEIDP